MSIQKVVSGTIHKILLGVEAFQFLQAKSAVPPTEDWQKLGIFRHIIFLYHPYVFYGLI